MELIDQSFEIQTPIAGEAGMEMLRLIERAGRTCYKSECKITAESAPEFVRRLIQIKKHESICEHCSITVRFITDRGVTHELVRHRIAAYSQESTRYCNYGTIGVKFIRPADFPLEAEDMVLLATMEAHYLRCLSNGRSPQQARYFLPNGLRTELVMTANLREWRHVLSLRISPSAHPQIRALMVGVLTEFKAHLNPVFGDIGI